MKTKKQPIISNLKKNKNTLQQRSIIFGMLQGQKWVSTKNQTLLKIEKSRSQTTPDNHSWIFLQNLQKILFRYHQWKKNLIHPKRGWCESLDSANHFPGNKKKTDFPQTFLFCKNLLGFLVFQSNTLNNKFQFFSVWKKGKCYDLNLTGRFAGNVCQNLNLEVWANVGNVQAHWERLERW